MLKGSFADYMRCPDIARPAPDLDVWLPARPDDMQRILREHLSATFYTDEGVLEDGFEIDGIKVLDSHLHLDEPGLKLLIHCRVGDKRERVKVNFAFGGTRPESMEIGVQLSMTPGLPELRVCMQSRERSCAEKLHAMAEFGPENTRVKDCWDLVRHVGSVDPDELAREVASVFDSRGRDIDTDLACLSAAWASRNEAAWTAWHEGQGLPQERTLGEAVDLVRPHARRALTAARRLREPETYLRLVPAAA